MPTTATSATPPGPATGPGGCHLGGLPHRHVLDLLFLLIPLLLVLLSYTGGKRDDE